MGKVRLLPGERIEARLKPHPMSFFPQYLLAASFALWGGFLAWMYRTSWWTSAETGKWYQFWTFLYGNTPMAYVFMLLGLALIGVIASLLRIKWSIFFAFMGVGLTLVVVNTAYLGLPTDLFVPITLAAVSVPVVLYVDLGRRSHKFVLTNMRILFRGGAFVAKERQLRYEGITDLDVTQGLFGKMFNYGTIIPVTQSGFGLGEDTSNAQMMVGGGAGKKGLFGGVGVSAGGGRGVNVGRARTFHMLTGIHPYEQTKYLLERLIQESTSTPYLREQVELQRQMVAGLQAMQGGYAQAPPAPVHGYPDVPRDDVPAFRHDAPQGAWPGQDRDRMDERMGRRELRRMRDPFN